MKIPNWGIVTGILMMLFGGCNITQNIQSISSPELMEFQKEIIQSEVNKYDNEVYHADSLLIESADSNANVSENDTLHGSFSSINKKMVEMFSVSDKAMNWIVKFGYIGIFVSLFYIVGGVFLLIRKPYSYKIAYLALVVSMLFSLTKFIILINLTDSGIITKMTGYSSVFGVIIDAVLLIIIITSDKEPYKIIADEI